MKRSYYWVMLLAVLTLSACEEKQDVAPAKLVFYKNFVEAYSQGDLELEMGGYHLGKVFNTRFHIRIKEKSSKNIYRYSKYAEEYEQLAVKNGDSNFDQWIKNIYYPGVRAFADNFKELHVVSNADWDDAHPAGTPLDDILLAWFTSVGDFVHSGYDTGGMDMGYYLGGNSYATFHKKLISQLMPADMDLIEYDQSGVSVHFTSAPTKAKEHTLTVEWTTVEGKVKTASITCTPEVDPELQL